MSENSYLITLLQKDNQTIIAYELDDEGNYTGVQHTTSFFAKANSKWKFTVIPDKYHEDYWIYIIQSDHQTIKVRDNSNYHDYRAGVLVSYPDDDKLTLVQAGGMDNSIYPETQYDTITEDPHDRYKYLVVNQNCRIFATLATDMYNETDYHTVSIIKVKHQTIVFTYRNKKYYDDTIVQDNEDYTIELLADEGYTAKSLIVNGKTVNSLKYTGKTTSNLTISAVSVETKSSYLELTFKEFDSSVERLNNSDGKLIVGRLGTTTSESGEINPDVKKCTINITQPKDAILHVWTPRKQGGIDHTSTFTVPVNTTFEAELIGNSGVLPGEICITSEKSTDNTNELNYVYQYKAYKIKDTAMKFGNKDNDLYASSLFDRNNLLYRGYTSNSKISSNDFIEPYIPKYYSFDYFFGYFDELEGSKVSNKSITIKNSSKKLTLRILGYNLFRMSRKFTTKTGRWVIGFNEDSTIDIKSITLNFIDKDQNALSSITNFKYYNTIDGDSNNSNNVKLYASNTLNSGIDSTFLYLLNNIDKAVNVIPIIEVNT